MTNYNWTIHLPTKKMSATQYALKFFSPILLRHMRRERTQQLLVLYTLILTVAHEYQTLRTH